MPPSNHIVIACSYLHVPGGYEKAMITTANLFAENGHRVTLLILDHVADTWYPVHQHVNVRHLPVTFGITPKGNPISRKFNLWNDTRKLKKKLKELKPDHLICTEYAFAIAAITGGAKKICRVYSWEHHHYHAQQLNRFWSYMRKRCYPKLDAVICLNPDEQEYYRELNANAIVIPNFIEPSSRSDNPEKTYDLLSVTRFNHIKGIDLLMEVAKTTLKQSSQLKWKVIGYGDKKNEFLEFIKENQLGEQLIYQPADQPDISHEYREAAVFVMTSRNECFPLVLLEAMREGLPCIAFDCETGPRHIIKRNETGRLITPGDTDMMAKSILQLLKYRSTQQEMSARALKSVRSYYPENIYPLWKQLFN